MSPVRALYEAVRVPGGAAPYDTAHVKIYYPAAPTGDEAEGMTGIMFADPAHTPLPVVIFFNGINVGIESYHWLADGLAGRSAAVVLYSYVAPTLPDVIGLTPGIDLQKVVPGKFGTGPTSPAIEPLLDLLSRLNARMEHPLQGALALDQVALGGHSAGGTVALQNGQFFPAVKAVFAYASHTMASTVLGFAPGTILPIGDKPALLLYGDRDGVIEASSVRYGLEEHGPNPVELTLSEGYTGSPDAGYAVCIPGANHFSIAHPHDPATGRGFLDHPEAEPERNREQILTLIQAFLNCHVKKHAGSHAALQSALAEPDLNNQTGTSRR